MEQQTEQLKRKRKLLLVLPLLLLPFITLAYWRLKADKTNNQQTSKIPSRALTPSLPGAKLKNVKPENKLSLYEDQKRDSATVKAHSPLQPAMVRINALGMDQYNRRAVRYQVIRLPLSMKVRSIKSWREINRQINRPEPETGLCSIIMLHPMRQAKRYADKLQKLMNTMNTKNAEDPEMKQLNGMLEKIMDIQHPERVAATIETTGKETMNRTVCTKRSGR